MKKIMTPLKQDNPIANTSDPTPGKGVVLPYNGKLPTIILPVVKYDVTLPTSPADGDQFLLADSTSTPTYQWLLRYNANSTNTDKWEFIGGSPGYNIITTSETTTSATYAALTTAGPSFALPRSGVYIVEIGCDAQENAGATSTQRMSYDIGGTGAVDADSIFLYTSGGASGQGGASVSHVLQKTGMTAVTLTAKYKTTTGTATFANRYMQVTPVRLS